jgi:hypothetical protein
MSIFGDLFKSAPLPVKVPKGLYKCRRCGQQFEYGDFAPCRADSGYKNLGGYYFWTTLRCDCEPETPERRVYGLADLIGATVTITYPTTVEIPGQ